MQQLRSVQVLRGVAALAVTWGHIYGAAHGQSALTQVAGAGVDLFFVISGFIMATVSRGRRPLGFLRDRIWRIYPLWLIAVLPWLPTIVPSWTGFASSLTLWPIYGGGYYGPALGVGWTLGFEMVFYCGVTLALASRPVVPLAIYTLCLLLGCATNLTLFGFLGSPMALEFLAGALIAQLPCREFKAAPLLLLAGLVCLALYSPHESRPEVGAITPYFAALRALGWGLPCAAVFYAVLSMERHVERPAFNGAVLLGDASYSLYLFHPLIAYTTKLPWVVGCALALALAVAVHLLIERRIMVWRRRLPAKGSSARPRQAAITSERDKIRAIAGASD